MCSLAAAGAVLKVYYKIVNYVRYAIGLVTSKIGVICFYERATSLTAVFGTFCNFCLTYTT
jgi:hypothetical protein